MSFENITSFLRGLAILLAVFLSSACAGSTEETRTAKPGQSVEPTPVAVAPVFTPVLPQRSPSPAIQSSPSAPPNENEIKDAVARVFQKAAVPDASRNPAFVVGDFNGDGSQDLAVLVRPTQESLGEINNELANWVLEDPRASGVQKPNSSMRRPKAPRAEVGEILLAVIHGVGAQGWRNPEARQTYLLKNAAASKMTSEPIKNLQENKDKEKLPPLRGDAIGEAVGDTSGLLYWTGAKYAWYRTPSK